jgi:hypothetical protein
MLSFESPFLVHSSMASDHKNLETLEGINFFECGLLASRVEHRIGRVGGKAIFVDTTEIDA